MRRPALTEEHAKLAYVRDRTLRLERRTMAYVHLLTRVLLGAWNRET